MTDPKQEAAKRIVERLINELCQPTPVGREYKPDTLAKLAAVLYGDNDLDVKILRGIEGPVAESIAYLEKSTGEFLLLFPDSRQYNGGNGYAFYTAAVLDEPGNLKSARCVHVHTHYLKNGCEAIELNDIPLYTQAALFDILARRDEEGVWDKKHVSSH